MVFLMRLFLNTGVLSTLYFLSASPHRTPGYGKMDGTFNRRKELLHVFIGEDDFSIRQALEGIKSGVGDATALMTNTTVLDGREVTVEQLRSAAETVPFLAEKRLVIVEGLLERFAPLGRAGGRKTGRSSGEVEYRAFAEGIKRLPEFTELVLIGGRIGGNNPLLRELAAVARVQAFPPLKEPQLRQWITRRVAGAGGSISLLAVNALVRFVGNDLWLMSNEVDKLVLYAGGRRIEEEDVRVLVSNAQEANIFAMVDAIFEFRVGAAQDLLQRLLKQGATPVQLLAMISRQIRIVFQIRELRNLKKTRSEIQSTLGLTSDFVLRKAWEQADKYSPARLRKVYHRLLETDLDIKTGKYDGDLALDILIAELGQRGALRS
jgi:DNA polymerase-3 subunit delta